MPCEENLGLKRVWSPLAAEGTERGRIRRGKIPGSRLIFKEEMLGESI